MTAPGVRVSFLKALHTAIGGTLTMPGRIWLKYGAIYIGPKLRKGAVLLDSLYVNSTQRGLGLGEYLLRHIMAEADRLGVELCLRSHSYGSRINRPDTATLRRWYRKHGFRACGGPWMVRKPRKPGVVRVIPRPRLRRSRP